MKTPHEMVFTKDLKNKKMTIVRAFDAPLELVWKAWTQKEILDEWWAPKPFRAETKRMDFRDGGKWTYSMVGPKGERHHCQVDFIKIVPNRSISNTAFICDEKGNKLSELPIMNWTQQFSRTEGGTTVHVELSFSSEADLEKIVQTGFKEGFTAALNNLDEYFSAH